MKSIINKVIESAIKIGAGATSTASSVGVHEPKRPEKLK